MKWKHILQDKLNKRREEGLLRELPGAKANLFDFASNDYLGLSNIDYGGSGLSFKGATGSRLLTGDSDAHHELEDFLALHFNGEQALVFNSGYQANLSVLSAIPQRSDTILYDELSHASIKDGVRLSLAKHFSFRHNDLDDLERKLKATEGQKYVIIEGIYSMDGDEAPLKDILGLSEKYEASVIIDEAHSGGITGTDGKGLSFKYDDHPALMARIYTFGKAWGAHGACFIGSSVVKDFLVNFSRPFIYTTALPLHSLLHIKEAVSYQLKNPNRLRQLNDKIHFFKEDVKNKEVSLLKSDSPIQPVLVPGNQTVRTIAAQIRYYGFDVRPILSPTVKKGTERLRICIHSFNKEEHILQLTNLLGDMYHLNY